MSKLVKILILVLVVALLVGGVIYFKMGTLSEPVVETDNSNDILNLAPEQDEELADITGDDVAVSSSLDESQLLDEFNQIDENGF